MDKETNVQAMDALLNQAVCIRIETLTEGIRLVFAGVMKMLESLDVDSGRNIAAAGAIAAGLDAKDNIDKKRDTKTQERKVESKSAPDPATAPASATATEPTPTTVSEPVAAQASNLEPDPASTSAPISVSTVTVDDITKIIVRKIEQNRSNNTKIGQILKAYGAAKVSELPASKYEAFLTDLASI
ncbi:MAG: hypothetical protein IJ855_04445 [Bacteroidales bacterium]|nr:hypothetical protein [Bacteroidales bacterium]